MHIQLSAWNSDNVANIEGYDAIPKVREKPVVANVALLPVCGCVEDTTTPSFYLNTVVMKIRQLRVF